MNIDETRQLGIEFERRIQTMIPETEYISKLDTETIYSYLNQYQDKFIHDIYKSLDQIPAPSKPSAYIETILRELRKTYTNDNINVTDSTYRITFPEDFGLYISSTTTVSDTYGYKYDNRKQEGVLQNVLMNKYDVDRIYKNPHDSMKIMRNPIGYIERNNTMTIVCDRYTTPTAFNMAYYKTPNYMNLFTSTPCELPIDAFEDLVSGAVDLYVQYVAGAEARKRQMAEQVRRQRNRNTDEDERG